MKYILAFLFGANYVQRATSFNAFSLGGRRTVDGAMVHFNKALDELQVVEKQELEEAARRESEIAEAQAALEAARREAGRAARQSAKLREFLGEALDETATVTTDNVVRFDAAAR